MERILQDREAGPSEWLFTEWGNRFGKKIDLCGKTVLETGHGGGWYLAQALNLGSKEVIGIEISPVINEKARQALLETGYTNFSLKVADDLRPADLPEKVDLIIANTVSQHLAPSVMREYLELSQKLMVKEGDMYFQVLENEARTRKSRSKHDIYSVSYKVGEVEKLINSLGFVLVDRRE